MITKLRPLFVASYLAIAVLLAAVGFVGVHTAGTMSAGFADIVARTDPALSTLRAIEASAFRMVAEATTFVLLAGRGEGAEASDEARAEPSASRPARGDGLLEGEAAQYADAKVRLQRLQDRYRILASDAELARQVGEAWIQFAAASDALMSSSPASVRAARLVGTPAKLERIEKAEQRFGSAIENASAVEMAALTDETNRSFARVRTARYAIASAAAAGIVLAGTIGLVLATRIVRRIDALKAAASRIGAGDLEVHVDTRGSDEISDLASAVEAMMGSLKRSYDDLIRKNKELDEFSYLASHDLQEPLRKLVSFSSLLREDVGGDLPELAVKDLDFIADSARRMQQLVEDLLLLSRVGRTSNKRQSVRLSDCVARALETLEMRVRETHATIESDELPEVQGDPTMLTQLYQNLIGNALKFTGTKPPVIRVTASRDANGWTFGVRDNGIGMKAQYLQQIFAPFKRLHGRSEYEGTGIGLAICRKAVDFHGGTIWVESEPGQGSHFKFTLNRRPVKVENTCITQTAA